MTEIYIFDRDFNLLGIIDKYVSVIWRPSYSEIGDFEIYMGATAKATELLKENRYAVRASDISVDNSDNVTYKKVMMIKNVHLVTDVENGDYYTVTGRELKFLLHQRIVWQQTILTGTAEDAIRRLVKENATEPTDTNRIIPGLILGDKAKTKLLPDDYTQLEYIEGTGTQYIDTGVVMDSTGYSTTVDFKFTGTDTTQQWLCGYSTFYEAGVYRGTFYNDGTFSYSQTSDLTARTTAKSTNNNRVSAGKSLFLFARNYSLESEYRPSEFRIYSAKISYKGEAVRELIPCKNPFGEIGMYDAVTGLFFGNVGTGEFIAGESVEGSELTDLIEKQVTGDYLDEAITGVCTAYNYGWDIYAYNNQFVFVVYQGINKSYGQAARPYVVFSEEFDNLYNTEYQLNTEEYANTALVGGEGEGLDRFYVTVGGENSGLDRFETLVDSRNSSRNSGNEEELTDYEYRKLLEEEGTEILAGLSYTEGFTGEVLSDVAFKYGVDFNLGDLVTVKNKYGLERNVRVISAIESEDESGTKLVPQFNI